MRLRFIEQILPMFLIFVVISVATASAYGLVHLSYSKQKTTLLYVHQPVSTGLHIPTTTTSHSHNSWFGCCCRIAGAG